MELAALGFGTKQGFLRETSVEVHSWVKVQNFQNPEL